MKINTKAFTLIELLAVIVILAIIALIATPIVLNIIKDSRESAGLRSAEMYLNAVEQSVSIEKMNNTNFKPNSCEIDKVNLNCEGYDKNPIKVEVNGEVPEKGTITFENGKIKEVSLKYSNNKTVVKNEEGSLEYKIPGCTLVSDTDNNGTITTGDEIECAKEEFYVIDNDGITISMLAKYNLNVGDNAYVDGTIGIQNENVVGYKSGMTKYGEVSFSTSIYWDSSGLKSEYGASYPVWVYTDKEGNVDTANKLYTYVQNYEIYLKGKGVSSANVTLINYEKMLDLKDNKGNPNWLYATSYWSGSAKDYLNVWCVNSSGSFAYVSNSSGGLGIGIRPVVDISVSEI